jgi:hypothetical protein
MAFKISGGGGGNKDPLPAGRYLAQVVDFEEKEYPSFNDREKMETRIRWTLDVKAQGSNTWQKHTIFTGTGFTDPKTVSNEQFISGLTKLVDAMGLPIPVTAQELQEFEDTELIGLQFIINVKLNSLTGKLTTSYERKRQAPRTQAAPEPEPQRELVTAGGGGAVDADDTDWD